MTTMSWMRMSADLFASRITQGIKQILQSIDIQFWLHAY